MQSDEIKVIPDSVVISGSYKKINTIKFVETEPCKFTDLEDTLKTKCKIKPIQATKTSVKNVEVIIPIEKYTEKSFKIPVKVKNCPDSLNLVTFPNEINLTYKVVLSKFKTAEPEDFNVSVDYNNIKENNEKLKINLESAPDFIKSVQLTPKYVEYIIEKKQ